MRSRSSIASCSWTACPTCNGSDRSRLAETVSEQFQIALEGEHRALELLHSGIGIALEEGDSASREFFAGRLLEEEAHVDYAETQLGLIQRLGEANYLAQQMADPS